MDWKEYQEKTAEFFRSIGMYAETNVTIHGVRTKHDVDVLVKFSHAGFDIKWVIECKYWKDKVSKLHVLALREIVKEIGADRGILLAEKGFQSGAIEAADLTNVQVTTLESVKKSAKNAINAVKIQDLFERSIQCKEQLLNLSKSNQFLGLIPDVGNGSEYSSNIVLKIAEELFTMGFKGRYPLEFDIWDSERFTNELGQEFPTVIKTEDELINFLFQLITTLEEKINTYTTQVGA